MESSIEASQIGGTLKPKPSLAPKPRLTPKPFSLQKSTAIRSIHAPKTVAAASKSTTNQTGKSEVTRFPKPTLTTPLQKPSELTLTTPPQKLTEATLITPPSKPSEPVLTTPPQKPSKQTLTTPPQKPSEPALTTSPPKPTQPTLTISPQKPTQPTSTSDSKSSSVTVLNKNQQKTTKASEGGPQQEDTLDSGVGKPDPPPKTTPPEKTPKSVQKDDAIQTNHKADVIIDSEQKDGKRDGNKTQASFVQKLEDSNIEGSSTASPVSPNRPGSTRRRLSMELTSRFESAGLSLPPKPAVAISTTNTKPDSNKPASSQPEQSRATPELPSKDSDEVGLKEVYRRGGSIKHRISLLFDSKPEVITKREEPEVPTKREEPVSSPSVAAPQQESTVDSSAEKSVPASKTTPSKETPKPEPVQKDDIIQTNHEVDIITDSEQKDREKSGNKTLSSNKESDDGEPKVDFDRGGSIKHRISRLFDSKPEVITKREEPELPTKREEPEVPTKREEPEVPTKREEPEIPTKREEPVSSPSVAAPQQESTFDSSAEKSVPASKTTPSEETPKPEPVQKDDIIQTNHEVDIITDSEQKDRENSGNKTLSSNKESDDGEPKEDFDEGGSIKRRISRLFDLKPEVITKREEPEVPTKRKEPEVPTKREEPEVLTKREEPEVLTKREEPEIPTKREEPVSSPSVAAPQQESTFDSSAEKSVPDSKTTPSKETPKSEPVQKDDIIQTNHEVDIITDSEQKDRENSGNKTSNKESDDGEPTEDFDGGGSIKRRISRLFDPRPEVTTKREEPEVINSTGGVKQRIKNWAVETTAEAPKAERKPHPSPKPRSRSFEPAVAPPAEETPKMPTSELSAAETSPGQVVDPLSEVSPAEQPTETRIETSNEALTDDKSSETTTETPGEQNKSTEGDGLLINPSPSTPPAVDGDPAASESAEPTLKRDRVKRRSVRFGIVETDDGSPPLILGSDSESNSDDEKQDSSEGEVEEEVTFPVYRRVGKKDGEMQKQEEERLKHLAFEIRQREEENEEARLKLEEEQKQEEEKREKERAREREELKLREEKKQREALKEEEMERQRKEEREREQLKEREREMNRLREEEMERQRQMELIRQREQERENEERLKQEEAEKEKERLKEEERQRLREEEERSSQDHKEHRLEGQVNSEKQREEEWGKEMVKPTEKLSGGEEEQREREKQLELMWQRQKEEDRERARQAEERLRQEREKERLREEAEARERERQARLEEEERMRERQRQEDEEERKRKELERKAQQEKEEELERMRQKEKQREEEEEKNRQIEKERIEELERKKANELKEKLRTDEENEGKGEIAVDKAEQYLINFDSEDFSQSASPYSPPPNVCEPTESLIDIVYDDFSVKKPLIEVDFDDFSVKPRSRGSRTKVETAPVTHNWAFDLLDNRMDEQEVLVPLSVKSQENEVALKQVEKPVSLLPACENPVEKEEEVEEKERPEEAQLISLEMEVDVEEEVEAVEDEGDEGEEEGQQEQKVNSYCTNDEDKDTEALIDSEQEQQDGFCDQTTETESSNPDVPEVSSEDVDAAAFHREPELAPLPESFAPLLDTTAQRSRADLGKKRTRTRPSRSVYAGSAQTERLDWRAQDSTDEKEESSKQMDSDSEEEQPKPKIASSPPTSTQRVPMFPGLKHADLMAQLKKRTGGGETGGGEKAEEEKPRAEKESQDEKAAPAPTPLPRSPRTAANLAGAARVLPPLQGKDAGAVSSPAWLQELKSKKRMSQHDINT